MKDRLVRHRLFDRVLHWTIAGTILVLLGTSLLPILGVKFEWVFIHWVTGLVMTGALVVHMVRAIGWQDLSTMHWGLADIRHQIVAVRYDLTGVGQRPAKPGKYNLMQQVYHHAIGVTALAAAVTGLMMLVKIDSPFWERNPYWLSQTVWGYVYAIHGFAALITITLAMVHVYFALRPEKLHYARSMVLGWITWQEYNDHHDPKEWRL